MAFGKIWAMKILLKHGETRSGTRLRRLPAHQTKASSGAVDRTVVRLKAGLAPARMEEKSLIIQKSGAKFSKGTTSLSTTSTKGKQAFFATILLPMVALLRSIYMVRTTLKSSNCPGTILSASFHMSKTSTMCSPLLNMTTAWPTLKNLLLNGGLRNASSARRSSL